MSDTDASDKHSLISMVKAEELCRLNHDYLAHLTRKGRLNVQKIGGVWVTMPADVADVRCDGFCYNLSNDG